MTMKNQNQIEGTATPQEGAGERPAASACSLRRIDWAISASVWLMMLCAWVGLSWDLVWLAIGSVIVFPILGLWLQLKWLKLKQEEIRNL